MLERVPLTQAPTDSEPARRRARTAFACALLCVALAACGSQSPVSPATSTAPNTATPEPTGNSPPELIFQGTVPVEGDRELAAECWGSGSPTIVLEAGGTRSNLSDWDFDFLMELASQNTVCRYSRAGGAGSTPPEGLLTYDTMINDAFSLLDWVREEHDIQPPYVFVGSSFGGFVALAEALERPEDTAGIVILDTDPPGGDDFMTICTGSGRTEDDCQAEFESDREAKEIGAAIEARVRPLPDVPAAIVSAMSFPDCRLEEGESTVAYNMNGADVTAPDCEQLVARVADIHAEGWAEILPRMTQTRVQATHDTLTSQATFAIAQVVRDVVAQASGSE